jgi:hypothetical protein
VEANFFKSCRHWYKEGRALGTGVLSQKPAFEKWLGKTTGVYMSTHTHVEMGSTGNHHKGTLWIYFFQVSIAKPTNPVSGQRYRLEKPAGALVAVCGNPQCHVVTGSSLIVCGASWCNMVSVQAEEIIQIHSLVKNPRVVSVLWKNVPALMFRVDIEDAELLETSEMNILRY